MKWHNQKMMRPMIVIGWRSTEREKRRKRLAAWMEIQNNSRKDGECKRTIDPVVVVGIAQENGTTNGWRWWIIWGMREMCENTTKQTKKAIVFFSYAINASYVTINVMMGIRPKDQSPSLRPKPDTKVWA